MIQPAEPIAIIGIGCRFPGAEDATEFWRLISGGFDHSLASAPNSLAERQFTSTAGISGLLADLDSFDCSFFGMSPREATYLDPQQRVLLEVAWHALEDAGLARSKLAGSATGVYAGLWASDFEHCLYDASPEYDVYRITGTGRFAATGRISYFLDLQGPSITLDTACSSSMVAVHLARRALLAGECNLAMAGGVNVLLREEITRGFNSARMLSPDRRCKFGDQSADGFVRTEGAAMVVLKRLSDAQRDGDRIYSILRGTAVNNDGGAGGLMLKPSIDGQQRLLRLALADACVSAAELQYVEAHGTGTSAGDPVELAAIGNVMAASGRTTACLVGSVKTNIGHTEGAAGIAGIAKVSLALMNQSLPRSLHNAHPTEAVPWDVLPIRLHQETVAWLRTSVPRIAGVSSFGITGTNAHAILGEAPSPSQPVAATRREKLVPFSAASPEALKALAGGYLARRSELPEFSDWGFTASLRRTHFDSRLSLVAASNEEAMESLQAFLADEARSGLSNGLVPSGRPPKIAFVFPGQGSQWLGMGRQLIASEPEFRECLAASERVIEQETGWRVTDVLHAPAEEKWLERIDVVQPLIFAISVALTAWWKSRGVVPEAVIGHSMGEVAAAHVAGILSLEDAAAVICRRSRLMSELSGLGAMALIELPMEQVAQSLRPGVSIAASNGPSTTVISGEAAVVDALLKEFESLGTFARRVKVDVSSHSAQVDPLLNRLRDCLKDLSPKAGCVPMYSTVRGSRSDELLLGAGYWADNLRHPVLFAPSVRQMIGDGFDTFVEMSAHPLLVEATKALLKEANSDGAAFGSLTRETNEIRSLLDGLGGLYCRGLDLDWSAEYPDGGRVVSLPAYAFQREKVWPDFSVSASSAKSGHPLLGPRMELSSDPGSSIFETSLGAAQPRYLSDHKVRDQIVFPAAGFWEMAIAAGRSLWGAGSLSLSNLQIHQALIFPATGNKKVQLSIREARPGISMFEIRVPDSDDSWSLCASGEIRRDTTPKPEAEKFSQILERCRESIDGAGLYREMSRVGLPYGPAFQTVSRLWLGTGESIAHVRLDEASASEASSHFFHTSLLDGSLVPIVRAAVESSGEEDVWMPVECTEFRFFSDHAGGELYAHFVAMDDSSGQDLFGGNLRIYGPDEELVAELKGIRFRKLTTEEASGSQCLFETSWQQLPIPEDGKADGTWVIFSDHSGTGGLLAHSLEALGGEPIEVLSGDKYGRIGPTKWEIRPEVEHDFHRLLGELIGRQLRGVAYCWALDAAPTDLKASEPDASKLLPTMTAPVNLLRSLASIDWPAAPRLWFLTSAPESPTLTGIASKLEQATLWGLGRVISCEHPEFSPTLAGMVEPVGMESAAVLASTMANSPAEDQIAISATSLWVPRLSRWIAPPPKPLDSGPYAVSPRRVGMLDSLELKAIPTLPLRPDDVRIRVQAGGMNFKDVLLAMGLVGNSRLGSCPPLGLEVAGIVDKVGTSVAATSPGDVVMSLVPPSCGGGLRSVVTVPCSSVYPIPINWTVEQAAAQLAVYLTAWYSLHHLARIRAGERVLIHSGAGGVGIAAINIAKLAGARVFATAGSEAKRQLLLSMGVEQVFDSRDLGFGPQILEATSGQGVDVVLNSLAGPFLVESIDILASYGRFVELGKRDIEEDTALGLRPFGRNLSFFAADLSAIMDERPDFVRSVIVEMLPLFSSGQLPPIPTRSFNVQRAAEAFQLMAKGEHVGKVVLEFPDEVDNIAPADKILLRPDAIYLVTGGLGGIGLELANWLVDCGAGHLMLIGRNAPSKNSEEAIEALRRRGVVVHIAQVDVSDASSVGRLISSLSAGAHPLRGVFHAAAVLDDRLIKDIDSAQLEKVFGAKARGAWHLHRETASLALDHFVLFSSIASILPQRGQGSYSAANAFLDGLAAYRRSLGLPALSLNWGGWKNTGLAQRAQGARRAVLALNRQGMSAMRPSLALDAMNHAMRGSRPNLLASPIDLARMSRFYEGQSMPPLLRKIASEGKPVVSLEAAVVTSLDELRQASTVEERRQLLEDMIKEQVSRVLRISVARIDRMKPFGQMGLDSLMAVEFINRVRSSFAVSLASTAAFNYPTVVRLAAHLAGKLEISIREESSAPTSTRADSEFRTAAVDSLSEEEAIQALISSGAALVPAEPGS